MIISSSVLPGGGQNKRPRVVRPAAWKGSAPRASGPPAAPWT